MFVLKQDTDLIVLKQGTDLIVDVFLPRANLLQCLTDLLVQFVQVDLCFRKSGLDPCVVSMHLLIMGSPILCVCVCVCARVWCVHIQIT